MSWRFLSWLFIWGPKQKVTIPKVVWKDGVISKSSKKIGAIGSTIKSLDIFYPTKPKISDKHHPTQPQ